MLNLRIRLQFFFYRIDRIDRSCVVLSTEIIADLFQGPIEIFLGKEHQNLPRLRDFLFPAVRFEFCDRKRIILGNHLYECRKIFAGLFILLHHLLKVNLIFIAVITKCFQTAIHIFLANFRLGKLLPRDQNI